MSSYLDPNYFIDLGLRSFMRHPFMNLARLTLREGQSDFHPLENGEGLIVTLGPNTSFFDRPNRSVCRWPGTKTIPRQSPHPIPDRSPLARELGVLSYLLFGGGDVKVNRVSTLNEQREILLTAGDGAMVEKIDLADLARQGAPSLLFLQPAYLCSAAEVTIRAVPCDASAMSWARAFYIYKAKRPKNLLAPAILCLAGRTMVWREKLRPGESRDFALGNVIAATTNVSSKLRPTSQDHPDDDLPRFVGARPSDDDASSDEERSGAAEALRRPLREVVAALRTLVESIRAREGLLVCEMTNLSDKPAFVFVQLNKSGYYGGSGLLGFAIRFFSVFFRLPHLLEGR